MDKSDYLLDKLRKDITETNLQVKAITQDIRACVGPLSELHNLNSAGRLKIASLRKFLDLFGDVARETKNTSILKDVVLFREQLTVTMEEFKNANIKSMLAIEQGSKEELLRPKTEESVLRQRQIKGNKDSTAKISTSITEQLISISRQLAETTKRSADTLDTLAASSETVVGTQGELKVNANTIWQSGKLLAKYGRRELTDKIFMYLAFGFFLSCVGFILQKRLF